MFQPYWRWSTASERGLTRCWWPSHRRSTIAFRQSVERRSWPMTRSGSSALRCWAILRLSIGSGSPTCARSEPGPVSAAQPCNPLSALVIAVVGWVKRSWQRGSTMRGSAASAISLQRSIQTMSRASRSCSELDFGRSIAGLSMKSGFFARSSIYTWQRYLVPAMAGMRSELAMIPRIQTSGECDCPARRASYWSAPFTYSTTPSQLATLCQNPIMLSRCSSMTTGHSWVVRDSRHIAARSES